MSQSCAPGYSSARCVFWTPRGWGFRVPSSVLTLLVTLQLFGCAETPMGSGSSEQFARDVQDQHLLIQRIVNPGQTSSLGFCVENRDGTSEQSDARTKETALIYTQALKDWLALHPQSVITVRDPVVKRHGECPVGAENIVKGTIALYHYSMTSTFREQDPVNTESKQYNTMAFVEWAPATRRVMVNRELNGHTRATALHEIGHLIGFGDIYVVDPDGYKNGTMGTIQSHGGSIMGMAESLTEYDRKAFAGLLALAKAGRLQDRGACPDGFEKFTPQASNARSDEVYCQPSPVGTAASAAGEAAVNDACEPMSDLGLKHVASCLESGSMKTVGQATENGFLPVYSKNPTGGEKRPLDVGLSPGVQVHRSKTCFAPGEGLHCSQIRIAQGQKTSLDVSKDYWIRLSHLQCL